MQEAERKLASVRVISDVSPIEGADKIEKATIDGWTCVAQKGEFKPGDLCVYFEIDSFLPVRPEFEFLRKSCYKKLADGREGFRLKTIKLRGTISQGLALPITILNDVKFCDLTFCSLRSIFGTNPIMENTDKFYDLPSGLRVWQGMDVTSELGVTKYEPPIPVEMQGKIRNFPGFLRKTDLERVQNIWNQIKDVDETFEVTIKLDGMSCTYYYYNGKFGVCSRNVELEENEDNTLWKIAKKYSLEEKMREIGANIALQGEVIGEGIQKNREKLIGQEFYLFDIFDIDNHCYLSPKKRRDTLKTMWRHLADHLRIKELQHVPIIEKNMKLKEFSYERHSTRLDNLLNFANGPSLNSPVREGVVFKSNQSDLRFKVISNEFLLKEESSEG